jgi:hypothetical protein
MSAEGAALCRPFGPGNTLDRTPKMSTGLLKMYRLQVGVCGRMPLLIGKNQGGTSGQLPPIGGQNQLHQEHLFLANLQSPVVHPQHP